MADPRDPGIVPDNSGGAVTAYITPSPAPATKPSDLGPAQAAPAAASSDDEDLPASAFANGSTVPTQGPAAQQASAEQDKDLPASAFANGSTTPGGPPIAAAPQQAPAAPLPPPNVPGASDLTAPSMADPLGLLARSAEATIRSGANAITGGVADKLAAGSDALPALFKGGLPALSAQYTSNMNAEQAQDQADQKQVPFATVPAAIAGAVLQAGALPEMKGLSLAGRIAHGAAAGSLFAGLNSIAGARGNYFDPADRIGQGAIAPMAEGAAIGGPLGAVLGAGGRSAAGIASPADHAVTGVDPMLALNGPKPVQQVGQMLKGLPGVGQPLQAAATRTAGQLKQGVSNLADGLGSAQTPFEAGGSAVRGAQAGVEKLKATADALYAPLNELDESDVKIGALNTQSAIGKIFGKYPNIPDWITQHAPKLASVQKTLQGAGGRLTFGELKSMRSDVGNMISDHSLVGNVDQARLKQLYAAMSRDMEAGVSTTAKAEAYRRGANAADALTAGQRAQAILKRANGYYSAMHNRIGNVLDQVVNAPTNESAFNAIVAASRSGARADLQQITLLKRSIEPAQWRDVAAGVVHTMGRAADDTFSVAKFDTELMKMTPEGRRILFGDDTEQLEALGRIARQQKVAAAFYNHSNTGHLVVGGLVGEHIMEHLAEGRLKEAAGVAALAPLGYAASKLLASPGFARLVLSASKAKSAGAADIVSRSMIKYANDNSPVADLVERYRNAYLARVKANLGTGLTTAIVNEAPKAPRPKALQAAQ